MRNLNKSKITFATALILLMAFVMLTALPANAQEGAYGGIKGPATGGGISGPVPAGVTVNTTLECTAYLSFRPNPVGLGQTFLVNMWTNPPLNNDRFHPNYEVTITKPDGTQKVITLNSYCADSTSWFEYTADQIGTWKIKFDFFGTYFPAGRYLNGYIMTNGSGNQYGSVYYTPASTKEQTLTVQQDPIYSWPQSPLPNGYWTRPAEPQNREWWAILGNYPSTGLIGGGPDWPADTNTYISNYDFYPYVQAPNTAHIVWKRQGTIGGIVGGSAGQYSLTGGGGNPSVIYAGRCYQTYNKQGVGSVAACYDLRTGQVYYEISVSQGGVTPSYISYAKSVSGGTPAATESEAYTVTLLTTVSGRLIKVDPWTGQVTLNVSAIDIGGAGTSNSPIAPSGFYQDPYALSVQTLGSGASISYRLINWTTAGSSTDFSTRIISNVSYLIPRTSLPYAVDFESNIACQPYFILDSVTGQWHKTTFTTIDLTTGALLWNITADETLYSPNCVQADHGKLLVLMQTGQWNCYNLRTGNLLWKSESMDYPWSAASFGAYECQSYGGLFYREAYDGVYAFNWTNGKIVWHIVAPTPFQCETPYTDSNGTGVYSFNAGGIIADGKLYVYNTEHTPTQPITRGWKLFCINATSGSNIWNITGCMTPGGIADGYLTASNSYDGYMYVFGKGQSATTISAPQLAVTAGQNAVITGTVLDQSPAQSGKACVSDESMSTYMEYLHMQMPMDGLYHNATILGVPVSIDAVDPTGNSVHLATVTSDVSGTFSYTWTPNNAGDYKITATFAGSDSYGSSWAETHANVVNTPELSSTPTQALAAPDYTMTIVAGVVAIIIAVLIMGVALVLILRKR